MSYDYISTFIDDFIYNVMDKIDQYINPNYQNDFSHIPFHNDITFINFMNFGRHSHHLINNV